MDYAKSTNTRLFIRFVLPQMVGLVFNSVYFIVDGVFIGRRLGDAALAAAGVAVPMVEGMIALSMLIAVGSGVLASAAFGRAQEKKARDIFNVSMVFTLALSALVAVLGTLFATPLGALLGAGDAILADTATYLRTFMLFSPFLVFSFVLSTAARNDGAPTLAMVALTVGSLSNILLDWVFMYPLNMGIGGAALATGLGPVFSVLILLPHFLRRRGRLYFARAAFALRTVGSILANGAPAFVAEFSIGFVTLLYNLAIVKNGLGDGGLAIYIVLGYAALICLTCFLGAAQGVQPLVSYFAAAGRQGRANGLLRMSLWFCGILSLLMYAGLALLGGGFYGIFLQDAALVQWAVEAGRMYFACLPPAAMNILLLSFAQAGGRVKQSLVISLMRSTLPVWLFLQLLPLAAPAGLWLALAAAEGLTLLLALWLSRRQRTTGKEGVKLSA